MSDNDLRWSREDVQRVLYNVVTKYDQAHTAEFMHNGKPRKTPRRFVFFGRRLPALGGDSELLRDAIRIARQTLKDNHWWPSVDVSVSAGHDEPQG